MTKNFSLHIDRIPMTLAFFECFHDSLPSILVGDIIILANKQCCFRVNGAKNDQKLDLDSFSDSGL